MRLDRDKMIDLLKEFGEMLCEMGSSVIIDIYGGAAMSILYSSGRVSEDIDVMLNEGDRFEFKEARDIIAKKYNLPENWINEAVAGAVAFDMINKNMVNYGNFGNLYINIVSAEQLLAMKIFSSRDEKDFDDAVLLAKQLGFCRKKDFTGLLRLYFKDGAIKRRNRSQAHYNGITDFIDNLVERLKKQ